MKRFASKAAGATGLFKELTVKSELPAARPVNAVQEGDLYFCHPALNSNHRRGSGGASDADPAEKFALLLQPFTVPLSPCAGMVMRQHLP